MSTKLTECEARALQLPPSQRAALAEILIASLDTLSDAQNEQLWLGQADRRYRRYKRGDLTARCAENVFRDARAAIK